MRGSTSLLSTIHCISLLPDQWLGHNLQSNQLLKNKEVDSVVGSCLLWSDVPFNIIKKNPFGQAMWDVVILGSGCKCPTYDEWRRAILQKEKD